jgi:hypothetical protein
MNDPQIQPMRAGLPYTPTERLQQLLLAVVATAMYRDDDGEFVASPTCAAYLRGIGLDDETALRVRVAFLQGRFQPHSLWLSSLDAPRFQDRDPRLEEAEWASWRAAAMG